MPELHLARQSRDVLMYCQREAPPGPAAMPLLKWFPPQGQPRTFVLYKPVTTVGRALGNDVAIPSDHMAETHVQVLFDGRDFNLEEVDKPAEILVNGKKKRRTRLVHG